MKILIEAQRIFRRQKHGMDFVALELIRQLQQLDHDNEYYILVAPGEDRCLISAERFQVLEIKCPFYPFWEQIALPQAIRKIKPDIVHCTGNTAPLHCSCPLVLTLHDIIFMGKKPRGNSSRYQNFGWYYRRFIVPRVLPKCRKIITVSQTESDNIQKRFPLGVKLTVIHNGYSPQYRILKDAYAVSRKYCAEKAYLLFLGNTDPRKNVTGVLKAYALYRRQSGHPKPLVITGLNEKYIHFILEKENIVSLKPCIHLTGYIPGEDLPALYNEAFAFLFPSLSEGFGIPILEAMACGTPVITSNLSAMPEVAGEEALLVNPARPEDIAQTLLQLERDSDLYQKQVNYGLQHVRQFSWQASARQVLNVYQNLNS